MLLTPLNSKARKTFYEKLRTYFGLPEEYLLDGILFVSTKNRYYLVDDKYREIAEGVRPSVMGMYIAEINDYGEIRLSLEGSGIIGPVATEHLLELEESEFDRFIKGEDLDVSSRDELNQQYYLIWYYDKISDMKDYLGCGKVKNGELFNFIPKSRRVHD